MAKNLKSAESLPIKSLSTVISTIYAGIPVASAQDTVQGEKQDSSESLTLEEVLVTATKRGALNLQDVPMSITAFTDKDIVAQGFKELDDYAGQIPSLSYGRREPGGSNVIIRGCSVSAVAFSNNPTTSVYLDEQPISQAGFNPDPRLIDIERVEALSGPQGTIFGEASQCGTLRIITNKPKTDKFESWVDLTGESVTKGDQGYQVSAMANIPLIEDTLALRLVGFTSDDAGWVDNILGTSPGGTFTNAGLNRKDVNKSTTSGGRVALRWTPNEKWTIDAQAVFQDTSSHGFGDIDLADSFYANRPLGKWQQLRFNKETWSDKWYQLALTAEGDLGWADATITAGYADRKTRYLADSTAYLFTFQQVNDYVRAYYNPYSNAYDFGGDPHAYSINDEKSKRYSVEARLTSPSGSDSRWSWIAGVFYNKTEIGPYPFTANVSGLSDNCNEYYAAAPGCKGQFTYASYLHYYYFGTLDKLSNNWWTGVYHTELKQKAVFGELTFDVTENLSITAGGRWYDIKDNRLTLNATLINPIGTTDVNCGTQADKDSWQIDGIPVSGVDTCYTNETAKSSESGFVPKYNATYKFNDDKMVYFTYSEGFRAGGANAGKPSSVFGAGNKYHTYKSDDLLNYEVGTKTTWANGRFQFNATAFLMKWKHIQIEATNPDSDVFSLGIVNFPEAEIKGVEANFSVRPFENLTVTGNLGYNDAALSKNAVLFPEGSDPKVATKGTRLPLVPKWKGSLTARYNFNGELFHARPYVMGVYQYQGNSVNSLQGIQSIVADIAVRTQPSYSISNLRVGLERDNWSATLYVDNVFNTYGKQLYNDRWAKTRLTATRPRTFGINYRYTWK